MHIVDVLARKRVHASAKLCSATTSTVARLYGIQDDDTEVQRWSYSPISDHDDLVRLRVRDRVKRGVYNIKALLRQHDNEKDLNEIAGVHEPSPDIITTRPKIQPIDLTDDLDSFQRPFNSDVTQTPIKQRAGKAPPIPTNNMILMSVDGSSSPNPNSKPNVGKRTSSARDLHRKISQKIQQALGDPTVIHRPQMKTGPNLQHLSNLAHDNHESNNSSSPSTVQDGSGSSRGNKQVSTPATSDTTTLSPASTYYSSPGTNSFEIPGVWSGRLQSLHDLNFERHQNAVSNPSIKTVEATATAKIFLETHFNTLLNKDQDRDIRRLKLEDRVIRLQLSACLCQKARDLLTAHETNHLRRQRLQMTWQNSRKTIADTSLARFEVIKVLGKGSFGVVRLVREKCSRGSDSDSTNGSNHNQAPSNGDLIQQAAACSTSICSRLKQDGIRRKRQVFAMKVIRKSDMIRNCQEGHLRAERDFLAAAEGSRWIIPLLAAFQDQKFLYLVMDYCIGGDFLGLLIRRDILCEEVTKWYIAEMVLCIEEAHRMKWIHRDVKPDNFLIGADGHLKISDFGLAFDGEWQHDQKYFHKQRHDLLEKLGIEIKGDGIDQRDQQATDNSRRLADVMHDPLERRSGHASHDEPSIGEPILDWRNRMQTRRLARSVVGTSQYMAPEIIRGDAYDGRCD